VNRVQPIEARGLASFFARDGELPEDLRDYFSEFNIIVSYLYDPDEIFQTNVKRCSPGQFIVGPHRPDETDRTHATQVFLKPLERLAIFDVGRGAASGAGPSTIHSPTLNWPCILGSGSERKNWPEEKWAELIEQLLATTDA
jgi:hypothetical protein